MHREAVGAQGGPERAMQLSERIQQDSLLVRLLSSALVSGPNPAAHALRTPGHSDSLRRNRSGTSSGRHWLPTGGCGQGRGGTAVRDEWGGGGQSLAPGRGSVISWGPSWTAFIE